MSVVEKLRQDFIDLLTQFLDALSETFSECSGVRKLKLSLAMGVTHALTPAMRIDAEKEIIAQFYEAISVWFDAIAKRDPKFFMECDHEILADVDLPGKYADPTVDDDTRDCIWEYVQSLADTLKMWGIYSKMDPAVVEKMQGVAAGLITPDGGIDLSAIDASSLMSLGESMLEGKTEEEAQAFAQSMIASATSVLGSSAGLGGAAQAGGFDVGAALSMFSGGGAGAAGAAANPAALLSMIGGGDGIMNLALAATKK